MPKKRKRSTSFNRGNKKQRTAQKAAINQLLPHLKEQQSLTAARSSDGGQSIVIQQQTRWLSQEELGINAKCFMLEGQPDYLSADTGASGFLAPFGIVKSATSIKDIDVLEYTSCRLDDSDLTKVQSFLKQEGLLSSGEFIVDSENQEAAFDVMLGNGTQHILDEIFKQVKVSDGDVMVCPVPTYGLLFKSMDAAGLDVAFYPLEKPDYKIKPEAFIHFIKEKNKELALLHGEFIEEKRDIFTSVYELYFDKNDNIHQQLNDLLTCTLDRSEDEEGYLHQSDLLNEEINHCIYRMVKAYCEKNPSILLKGYPHLESRRITKIFNSLKIPLCPRVRAILHVNPNNPLGTILTQTEVLELATQLKSLNDKHLLLIDDLTHKDILMGSARPGFFSRTPYSEQTISLIGLSKSYGLSGFRVGLALGENARIAKLNERLFDSQLMINVPAKRALLSICSMSKSTRNRYLSKNNKIYQFRWSLVKALLDGIGSISDKRLHSKIEKFMSKPEFNPYQKELVSGIKDVTLTNKSEGGFFVNLDFSLLLGRYVGDVKLNNGFDFQRLFYYLADVNLLPNELNGEINSSSLRFSLSLDEDEILQAFARIKNVLQWVSPKPNPKLNFPSIKPVSDSSSSIISPSGDTGHCMASSSSSSSSFFRRNTSSSRSSSMSANRGLNDAQSALSR